MKPSAAKVEPRGESWESPGRFFEINAWKRREHFELFRGFANPFFSVCVEVDATRVWEESRQAGSPSFYVSTLFNSLRAANATEAFRLRIRGDRVWLHDSVRASATILREDDTFGFGIFPPAPTLEEFKRQAVREVAAAKRVGPLILPRRGEDDLIYHSSLPWMRFTAFTNALNGGKDSVPRVVFGKCAQCGGRWTMPVAVEVHHALVDGLDVARYLEAFQAALS